MRRWMAVVVLGLAVTIAACGDDGGEPDASPTEATTTVAPEAPTTTASPEVTTTAPADDAVAVVLDEFTIETGTTLAAGPVSFSIDNVGEFPHQFTVVRGDSYETLPQTANGAVDEEALDAGAIIGASDRVASGETADLTVELEPGNYVFYCNIAIGPNSHAGRGQVLSVTVG